MGALGWIIRASNINYKKYTSDKNPPLLITVRIRNQTFDQANEDDIWKAQENLI